MTTAKKHKWAFQGRFKRHSFGWRSQLPVKRVKEAVAEIKKTARKAPLLAAEGAVLFLERVSPALEHVDSSSGAIGAAVNNAITALVPVISGAPADDARRDSWMEQLFEALKEDQMPYIETLADFWGELCKTKERASHWADNLIGEVRFSWSKEHGQHGYFFGTPACMSSLLSASRYQELLELIEEAPFTWWHYRRWGVKALAALGKPGKAIRYAEESRGLNDPLSQIAEACEEILIAHGLSEEAYKRYSLEANRKGTYLATFRAIVKKYPRLQPGDILSDLVANTPGDEGKWFAAARSAGFFDIAIELANRSYCDPKTLTRAARDAAESHPHFAMQAGLAALRWMLKGCGFEITGIDVLSAYEYTIKAAENADCLNEALIKIRELVKKAGSEFTSIARILNVELKRRNISHGDEP